MISYFSTDRENIARRQDILDDPSTPNVDEKDSFFVLSGQEEASGVEFDLQVDFTDSWNAIFGGSFFDANTVSNIQDPAQVGLPPQDVVMNSFNFQTVYKFNSGSLKGWSFSVGGYWRDNFRTEGNANQIKVQTDDHYILNAFVRRAFEWNGRDVTVTLSVNNLLDERGYIINGETFGPPLMAWLTAKYKF
jgi:outer membrane receptor for ferric coprogen and ferric-rhodotorulic acid